MEQLKNFNANQRLEFCEWDLAKVNHKNMKWVLKIKHWIVYNESVVLAKEQCCHDICMVLCDFHWYLDSLKKEKLPKVEREWWDYKQKLTWNFDKETQQELDEKENELDNQEFNRFWGANWKRAKKTRKKKVR